MRAPIALILGLALVVAACEETEAPNRAPEPEAADEPPTPAPAEPGVAPRRPPPVAPELPGEIPAALLPPPPLSEADRARADELASFAGFALGQTRADAEARCEEVEGTFSHVERTIHRCVFPEREAQPRTHVDVILTPGGETVGRTLILYESGAGEPLVPSFVAATQTLAERLGPPRSQAESEECATANASLLHACLARGLEPVRQSWSAGDSPAGDVARLEAASIEDAAITLRPTEGRPTWVVIVEQQRAGYTQAFVDAYADESE